MAIYQATSTHRNDKTDAKTLLLSTKKTGDIQAFSTVSEFFYEDNYRKTTLYRTALTKDQMTALVEDAREWSNRVELYMLGKSTVKTAKLSDTDLFAATTVINVNMDKLIKGWDIGATSTSYLQFELGKKIVLYKVNDTIANIEGASSTSVSIA